MEKNRRWWALVAVALGTFMTYLDNNVVNVALPSIQRELDLSISGLEWITSAYILVFAGLLLAGGRLGDVLGHRMVFLSGLGIFTVASVAAGMADGQELLIGARAVQGIGAALLSPAALALIQEFFPDPKERGAAIGIWGAVGALALAVGPLTGGLLSQHVSWGWIFLINLPIGVVALVYAWWALEKDSPEPSESFDFLGMLMLSPGLASFLYGVSSLPGEGSFGATKVWVPMLIGALLVIAFVFYSFKPKHPLLDLRLLRNRNLTVATVTLAVFTVAFMGAGLLFPSYFLQVRGESTLSAGLLMAPQGIGAMVTMPIAGMLADKIPVGRTVPFALLLIAAGFFTFTQVGTDTSYVLLCGSLFVMGLGMGGTMMPIMTSALKTLTNHEVARGSTLLNILQQIAGSVGTAMMSVILTNQLNESALIPGLTNPANGEPVSEAGAAIAAQHNPQIAQQLPPDLLERGLQFAADSFGTTFWVGFVLTLATLIPAFFLPRKAQVAVGADGAPATPIVMH